MNHFERLNYVNDMSYNFSGKVALVTGGTSGIGQAVASAFTDSGATVIICGRNTETGELAAGKISRLT